MVRDIEKQWLGKHFSKPRLRDLRHITTSYRLAEEGSDQNVSVSLSFTRIPLFNITGGAQVTTISK